MLTLVSIIAVLAFGFKAIVWGLAAYGAYTLYKKFYPK